MSELREPMPRLSLASAPTPESGFGIIPITMRTDQEPPMTTARRIFRAVTAAAMLAVMVIPLLGTAMAAADDSIERRFREMTERIDALERDNDGLRQEVTRLQHENGDPWLTEQRAAEIRSLVTDVLADADARSSLQANGLTAGWNDGFFLASPDGRFRLQADGQIQFRYIFNVRDTGQFEQFDKHRGGFENTRTRLTLRGHVFGPQFSYLVRGGFSRGGGGSAEGEFDEPPGGSFRLYDAWIRLQLDDLWALRFGQFKLPFMREELVASSRQLLVERSLINEMMSLGRSQGIELAFAGDWLRWNLAFSDGMSDNLVGLGLLANTQGANSPWNIETAEYAVTTRAEWLVAGEFRQFDEFTSRPGDPFGVLVGAAGHIQQREFGLAGNDNSVLGLTADVSVAFGGANLFASASYIYVDNEQFGLFDIFGAVVQGGVYVAPKTEVFARGEFGYIDSRNSIIDPDNLWLATIGVNQYFDGHDLKFTADFGIGIDDVSQFWVTDITGWRADGTNTAPQWVIRTQFQLLF